MRFVHASPDAGAVDIAVEDGPTLLEGVEFGDASGYLEIAPGDYDIDVGPGALEVDFEAVAGTKVTAYVIGNVDRGEAPMDGPLAGVAQEDAELSAVTSVEATNPAGTGDLPGDRHDEGDDEDDESDDEDDDEDDDDDDEEDEDDDDDEDDDEDDD